MKSKFISLFLFIVLNSFSQSVVVVDSISKTPLSFSIIKYNDSGFYTDIDARFDLGKVDSDTLEISYLGYYRKKLNKQMIKDTIALKEKSNVLDAVVISNQNKIKVIKPLKRSRTFPNVLLPPQRELLIVITPKESIEGAHIEKIMLQFDKMKEKKAIKHKNFTTYIRINIYRKKQSISKSINQDAIYSSKPIAIDLYQKDRLELNIINENVFMNKEGLVFGVEMIGNVNNHKEFISNSAYIRPRLTPKKSKYFIASTYIKNNISKNSVIIEPLNDLLNKGFSGFGNETIDRNLSIGFEIRK